MARDAPDKLCSACDAIRTGRDEPWYYITEDGHQAYQHHQTPAYLHENADGCHICKIIWRKLDADEQRLLDNTWKNTFLHRLSESYQRLWDVPTAHYSWSRIRSSEGSVDQSLKIRFQFGYAPIWKKIVFRLLPTREMEELNDGDFGPRCASPDSMVDHPSDSMPMWTASVQGLVQRWNEKCTRYHRHCHGKHLHENFKPHRILDLSDDKIRLDTDPEKRVSQPYATLTHRWPADDSTISNMPKLDDQNLDEWREEGIDTNILTPTFRDAVDVVRRLDIRFLWIDSLCIKQRGPDKERDWQTESVTMGEIYRNAFLNIQAGRDANQLDYGLFNTPDTREVRKPYPLGTLRTALQPMSTVHTSNTEIPTFSIIEEDFARDELLGNPINHRGWVLQERLLSHRILHFGAQQVFWECHECLACETFPSGIPEEIPKTMARAGTTIIKMPTYDHTNLSFTQQVKQRMSVSHRNSSPLPIRSSAPSSPSALAARCIPLPSFGSLSASRDLFAWFYLVELYSTCSLTCTEDKLVAISGLAKIFGSSYFLERAVDVVAHLRALALPRSGGAVSDINLNILDSNILARYTSLDSQIEGDYLAGLWRKELFPCLLWYVANGRQVDGTLSKRISNSPRAPNWSWASINGLINASVYQNWSQGIDGMILAELSYANTTPKFKSNLWGQVREGIIRMHGKVIHETDLIWPGYAKLDELARGEGVRAHKNAVTARMVRKIRRNVPSVARVGVLKADVLCYVDDVEEFVGELKHSGAKYEIGLLPLVGLQHRRPDWGSPEGYTDEIFAWHGLVVKLWKSKTKKRNNSNKDNASSINLTRQESDGGYPEDTAHRLGYFSVRDTRLFKKILDKTEGRDITLC